MIKAVIFDFNGTLFFDTEKHEKAWMDYSEQILGHKLTDKDLVQILGRTNKGILEYILGNPPSDEDILRMGDEKEEVYRNLCLSDRENMHLADGADKLLDSLKEKNIPVAIATSSDLKNVNFYFEYFGIDRWFDRSVVIYNDGTFNGKPAPDIYLKAADRLGIDISDCAVFEDAVSGVSAAYNAGAGKIFAIASATDPDILLSCDGVTQVVKSYNEITADDIIF